MKATRAAGDNPSPVRRQDGGRHQKDRGSRQINLGKHAGRLSRDLTPQRKYMGIFMDFDIVQKCENSLSPRSSLY